MKEKLSIIFVAILVIAFLAILPMTAGGAPSLTNFSDHVHIFTTGGTATPALRVNQAGAGKIVEFSDGGTPVFSINNGGAIVASTILTQGATLNNLIVGQPTAATTATPAALIDSLAAGSNLLEVRDAATPVFTINNGGAWSSVGAGTHTGGQTINNWAKVAAPTAIATATPAAVIDSAGVSNILEVRDAATPVFSVGNGGPVTQPLNTKNLGALPSIVTTAITYTAAAGGSGVVATIPDGEIWFVHKVFVQTTTNFDCTGDDCTLTIGDGNDADGFIAAADAALQATFTEATGFEPGFYGIENGSGGAYTTDDGGPFVYLQSGSAETIDWTLAAAGNDFSAGAATIYVLYTRIQ